MHSRCRLAPLFAFFAAVLAVQPAQAQSYPPAWNSSASYATGDQVQIAGNVYRAIGPGINHNPATAYASWELHEVRANTTLMIGIGQTFPSTVVAWKYIQNAAIDQGAYVHLVISTANGLYRETWANTFNLDHPFGASISLLGDNNSRIDITSQVQTTACVLIDTGHSFGTLANFYLIGNTIGIHAATNASINNLAGVTIQGCNNDSVLADLGAVINCATSMRFVNPQHMFHASTNGVINIQTGFTTSTPTTIVFYADYGGVISAQGANLNGTDNAGTAAYAECGGTVSVLGSQITGYNTGLGAYHNGRIIADTCTVTGDGFEDADAANDSFIEDISGTLGTKFAAPDGSVIVSST